MLADAVGLFGDIDLSDTHIILKLGDKASGTWAATKTAVHKIRASASQVGEHPHAGLLHGGSSFGPLRATRDDAVP